jgi:hypothetical protein
VETPNLTNLTGMSKNFYESIVVPMVKKSRSFGEKVRLCARVKKVTELFIGLNSPRQGKDENKKTEEIFPIFTKAFIRRIRALAFHDLVKLQKNFHTMKKVKFKMKF